MKAPDILSGQTCQVDMLRSLFTLDTKQEPLFEDITYLASEICEVSTSLISLTDEEIQWFNPKLTADELEKKQDTSFCGRTILGDDIFEVEDATLDARFKQSPLVTSAPYIRFYAGMPLVASNGARLGTICVFDSKPKKLNQKQRKLLFILARDIASQLEMRKKSQDLRDSKELQVLISETNQDLIFVKDQHFNLVYANKAFMSLYPTEMQDQIIGNTTSEAYSSEEIGRFLEQDRIAFEKGLSQKVETIVFPVGKQKTLITTKRYFTGLQGQPYILGVSRDITEQTNLIKSLERSNKDLDEFAQVASHDLKAPLNAVKSLIGFIEQDCSAILPPESLEHFSLIQNRVLRMQKLLDELLEYAQMSKTRDEYESLNLREFVSNLTPLIDKPETFQIFTENGLIHGPKTALNTMLLNLISNAVKHHERPNGRVDISTKDTHGHYNLTVRDDGPGIATQDHQRIFNLFQTLKPRDDVEGTGMGLATVKKLIEHYDGTVTINSTGQDDGSEFTLTWPKSLQGQYE